MKRSRIHTGLVTGIALFLSTTTTESVDFTVEASFGSNSQTGASTWSVNIPSLRIALQTTNFPSSTATIVTAKHQLQDGTEIAMCQMQLTGTTNQCNPCSPQPANFGVVCNRSTSSTVEIIITLGRLDDTRNQSKILLQQRSIPPADWNYDSNSTLITLKECDMNAFFGATPSENSPCGYNCNKDFTCVQGPACDFFTRTCTSLAIWNDTIGCLSVPDPPTLKLGAPLPNAIEVFIDDTNCSSVAEWFVEYNDTGSDMDLKNVSTLSNYFYAVRIEGLRPNTEYQVRARASKLYGNTVINESDFRFSEWKIFNTAPLSAFGSVVLNSVAYTPQHAVQYSAEWNSSLAVVVNGYSSIPNEGISIIRIENSGGNARVHYRIKVEETSLDTSSSKYVLSGSDFTDSFVNSGDKPLGTAYIEKSGNKWTLFYLPDGSCTGNLVERYMKVSPDDEDTFEIHLNVASSDATTADEEDGLRIGSDGNLIRDDGISSARISRDTVIGLTPRFLIKDCLVGQPAVALYSELYAPTVYASTNKISHIYEYIEPSEVVKVNESAVTYTSSDDGTSVTLHIPPLEKAILYEVLNASGEVVASLDEKSICCTDTANITVEGLVDRINYSFTLRVTTRNKDATTSTTTSDAISVTSTNNLELTTEVMTTSEPTTDEITISELTTEEMTTNEPTTKEMRTSELTTEGKTTSELSTDEITTSQLTTGEMATSESTTMEKTTSEPTTEEMRTSESTTEETTTSDLTTEGMTTSELTTEEITTKELSTEGMTTSKFTTEVVTTSELTTEEIASRESTAAKITTSQLSTEGKTTSELSTDEITTSELTTEEMATSDSTTKERTTSESTTEETTTSELTTEGMTTSELTTEEITKSKLSTEEMTTNEFTTEVVTTSELTTEEIASSESTAAKITTSELSTDEITTSELTTEEMATSESTTEEMTTSEPTTEKMQTSESTTEEITTNKLTTEGKTTSELSTEDMRTSESTTEEIATSELSTEEMTTSELTTEKITTSELTTEEIASSESTADEITTSESMTAKITTSDSTTERKATSESTTEEMKTNYFATETNATSNPITQTASSATTHATTAPQSTSQKSTTLLPVSTSEPSIQTTRTLEFTTKPGGFQNVRLALQQSQASNNSFKIILNNITSEVLYIMTVDCGNCSEENQTTSSSVPEFTVTGLTAGENYTVCVTASLSEGENVTNITECSNFLTRPPAIDMVDVNAVTRNVTLTWESVKGAEYYVVWFVLSTRRKKRDVFTNGCVENVTGTSITVDGVLEDSTYDFAVAAANSAGQSVVYQSSFTTTVTTQQVTPDPSATTVTTSTKMPATMTRAPATSATAPTTLASTTNSLPSTSKPLVNTPSTFASTTTIGGGLWTTLINTVLSTTSAVSSTTPEPTIDNSVSTAEISTKDPSISSAVPWWFVFSTVSFLLIVITYIIIAIVWCRKKKRR